MLEFSRFRPLLTFAAARNAWAPLGVSLFLALLTVWLGREQAPIPSVAVQSGATFPMWRLLALGVGVLPGLAMYSRNSDMETSGSDLFRRMERRYLAVMTGAVTALYLTVVATHLEGAAVAVIARSLLGWVGLSLLSGQSFGWRLSWVVPICTSFVLTYWGGTLDGTGGYRWWEFSAHDPRSLPTFLLASALFGCGLAAFAATAWRRTKWRAPVHRGLRRTPPAS